MTPTPAHIAIWVIAALAAAGVLARPFRWPEAVWATAGAALLLLAGLISWAGGLGALAKALDVCLFLTGMMLLSETARRANLFDWVAARAVNLSRRSPRRLFLLIYVIGAGVTILLSNDATAVVLTPAVYAAARQAKVAPLPYLYICAFIANAASFVLPISNPANLVLYGDHTPPLGPWLARFALPSALSILATYVVLRRILAADLRGVCEGAIEAAPLGAGGKAALLGLGATALALISVSALDLPLGGPTCLLGVLTTALAHLRGRQSPWPVIRGVSWSVLPLVGGLFIIVEALTRSGLIAALGAGLSIAARAGAPAAAAIAGGAVALGSNLINNLPAGLIASRAIAETHAARALVDAVLIGVDLGPNLSITGSLATILWLAAIRREGQVVGFWRFLRVGALVTPPALALAIGARLLLH